MLRILVRLILFKSIDFFSKRHDSNPPQAQRQVPDPAKTQRGWFSTRRENEEIKITSWKGKKVDLRVSNLQPKPSHLKTRSNVQDLILNNRILDKPIVQNTNHIMNQGSIWQRPLIGKVFNVYDSCVAMPNTKAVIDMQSLGGKKFKLKPKRNGSIKDIKRVSQERLEAQNIIKPGHKKNTKSLKFDQGTLKQMLVEKLHKRYDLQQDLLAKRTIDTANVFSTQRNFNVNTNKLFESQSQSSLGQKKFVKRRKSRQGSKDSIARQKHHVIR